MSIYMIEDNEDITFMDQLIINIDNEQECIRLIQQIDFQIKLNQLPLVHNQCGITRKEAFMLSFYLLYYDKVDSGEYYENKVLLKSLIQRIITAPNHDNKKEAFLILILQLKYPDINVLFKEINNYGAYHLLHSMMTYNIIETRTCILKVLSNDNTEEDFQNKGIDFICEYAQPFIVFKYLAKEHNKIPTTGYKKNQIKRSISYLINKFPDFKKNYFYYIKKDDVLIDFTDTIYSAIEEQELKKIFESDETKGKDRKRL